MGVQYTHIAFCIKPSHTAPTAAGLLRVLDSWGDPPQLDAAVTALVLWLRALFLRGGAALQASVALALLNGTSLPQELYVFSQVINHICCLSF